VARKPTRAPGPSRWHLLDCPTNRRAWNPEWQDTRGLSRWARRGDVVALNSFGTVRLFGVADPHDVQVLGALELPELTGGLPEDLPIGFDRAGCVVQASGDALHVVDVADPMQPRLVSSRAIEPALSEGRFVDGVLYRNANASDGLYAHDGAQVTPFMPELRSFLAPHAITSVGEYLYVFDGAEELRVVTRADLKPVRTLRCPTGYNSDVVHAPDVGLIVTVGSDVHIIDTTKPDHPKLQKRLYKRGASGAAVDGDRLYIVDGEYQKPQWLTTIALGRPASTIVQREPFTTDPELGSGFLFVALHGGALFVLTTTGRFAVLAS
jgi:hypothetical protein